MCMSVCVCAHALVSVVSKVFSQRWVERPSIAFHHQRASMLKKKKRENTHIHTQPPIHREHNKEYVCVSVKCIDSSQCT